MKLKTKHREDNQMIMLTLYTALLFNFKKAIDNNNRTYHNSKYVIKMNNIKKMDNVKYRIYSTRVLIVKEWLMNRT